MSSDGCKAHDDEGPCARGFAELTMIVEANHPGVSIGRRSVRIRHIKRLVRWTKVYQ
jgi:hypothetical protein